MDTADDNEDIEEEVTVAISTLSLDDIDDTSTLCLPNTLSKVLYKIYNDSLYCFMLGIYSYINSTCRNISLCTLSCCAT